MSSSESRRVRRHLKKTSGAAIYSTPSHPGPMIQFSPTSLLDAHEKERKQAGLPPLQCGGCKACCYDTDIVLGSPDDVSAYGGNVSFTSASPELVDAFSVGRADALFDIRKFPDIPEEIKAICYTGFAVLILNHREDGACSMLWPDGCTVYDKRPMVCRMFDCRLYAKKTPSEERVQQIKFHVMPAEVFAAGDQRLQEAAES